ncbi:hypothetical protein P7C70_g2098, partial [Phenoliferia sp. Uapishka_3]
MSLSIGPTPSPPSSSTPVGPHLLSLLTLIQTHSLLLFTALSSPTPPATLPTTIQTLLSLSTQLSDLLPLIAEHQRQERRVQQLVRKLETMQGEWVTGVTSLRSAVGGLKGIVQSGALDRQSIALSSTADPDVLTPKTILAYARLLAPFTSAPPESLYPPDQKLSIDPSGRGLPVGALPPFPTEGVMRRGRLQFGREGVEGMGELVGGEHYPNTIYSVRNLVLIFVLVCLCRAERKDPNPKETDKKEKNPEEQLKLAAKQQERLLHEGGQKQGEGQDDDFAFELDLDL